MSGGGSVGPTMSGLDGQTGQGHLGHEGAAWILLTDQAERQIRGIKAERRKNKGMKKKAEMKNEDTKVKIMTERQSIRKKVLDKMKIYRKSIEQLE